MSGDWSVGRDLQMAGHSLGHASVDGADEGMFQDLRADRTVLRSALFIEGAFPGWGFAGRGLQFDLGRLLSLRWDQIRHRAY